MKKLLLVLLVALPLLSFDSVVAQSNETAKTVANNQWLLNCKKLKHNLENLGAEIKESSVYTEDERARLERSYNLTSKMMNAWINEVVKTLGAQNKEALELVAKGSLTPKLKDQFMVIAGFYSNNFLTDYEELTGKSAKAPLISSESDLAIESSAELPVLSKENLEAYVRTPLTPASWNNLY